MTEHDANPIPHELHDLLAAMLDGSLDPTARDHLRQLVRDDPAARAFYLDYLRTHVAIQWQFGRGVVSMSSESHTQITDPTASPTPTLSRPRRSVWSITALTALAAALILAAAVVITMMQPAEPHEPATHPAGAVAVLTGSHNAVFADNAAPATTNLGSELAPGPLHLSAGAAQLMFNSTAVVDLIGPCDFTMTGPNAARLTAGSINAFVPQRAHGFTVDLPAHLSVTDLGTQFGLQIDPDAQQAFLQVEKGRVEMRAADQGDDLTAGQLARGDLHTGRWTRIVANLSLTDSDFESAPLAGWTSNIGRYIQHDRIGLGFFDGSAADANSQPPAGFAGRGALRLGYRYQGVSLHQQTDHAIEPGATYTLAVRAAAEAGADSTPKLLTLSLRVDGRDLVRVPCTVGPEWRWYIAVLPASLARPLIGHRLEIALDKPANHDLPLLWIDQVMLNRSADDQPAAPANQKSQGH